ncbi:MAG: diphthine--ammonia ligase [Candidatus Tectomicrobia bacterium]|nr:diphthine--ammonia ligase [Candidatus Tectomicrobia bacterium]
MGKKEKIVLSWSGGKDSALALFELRRSGRYEIHSLLTTVAGGYDRVSHHGVRAELLERQAAAVGAPLHKLYLPADRCSNQDYEAAMEEAMLGYKEDGVRTVAFGDIFLRDLREYRERNLAKVGMSALFPIWGRDTAEMARTFIGLGFKAYLCCVDARKLGEGFAGRAMDADLVRDLPEGVDPCGENGEFHSFVYDGPVFRRPVGVGVGEVVLRDVRYFADLLPVDALPVSPPRAASAEKTGNPNGNKGAPRC